MIGRYFWNIFISMSQLLNVILGGDPDETLSSRTGKMAHRSGWRLLARILDAIDPGHTRKAREDDEGKDATFPNL